MSLPGHVRFPPAAHAALPAPTPEDTFFAFIASQSTAVFLVELIGQSVLQPAANDLEMPIAGVHRLAWIKQPALIAGVDQQILLSSRIWIGRPDDPGAPSRPASARLAAPLRIQRSIPVSPDESRRSQSSVGTIEMRNADRRFDSLIRSFRVRGLPVTVRYGPRRGRYQDMNVIAKARAKSVDGSGDQIRVELEEIRNVLNKPLQSGRYDGRGGLGGDFDLEGQVKPTTVGHVFNMSPVRISRLVPMYQVNAGRVFGIPTVYERLLPFTPSGVDTPTFLDLYNLAVAPGEFATCLAQGLFKLGAEPAGTITCDVFGASFGGSELRLMGEILLAMAINRLGVTPSLANTPAFYASAFNVPIGWTSQQRDLTGLQFFEEILAAPNGSVGLDRFGRVTIQAVKAPELQTASRVIKVSGEKVKPQFFEAVITPVQRIRYRKNWTVMDAADISPFADAVLAQWAQGQGYVAQRASPIANSAYGVADDGTVTDSVLRDAADADDVALQRDAISGKDRNLVQVRDLPRDYFDLELGQYVRLEFTSEDRFGLQGLNFCVRETSLDGKSETVGVELYG